MHALLLAFLVGEGHAALFAERRIGEDIVHRFRGLGDEGIGGGNEAVAIDLANVVEEVRSTSTGSGKCQGYATVQLPTPKR